MLSHGHSHVQGYTVGTIWAESSIIRERVNGILATEAALLQSAVASVVDKNAGREFSKTLKRLHNGQS